MDAAATTAALQRLRSALVEAWKIFEVRSDSGRAAAIMALNGVVDFVENVDELREQHLAAPLAFLAAALGDLGRGSVPRMLEPRQLRGGRPVETYDRVMVKGAAAATISILMASGFGRVESAKGVAAVLRREGVMLGGRRELSWRSVASWRDQMKKATESDANWLTQTRYTQEDEAGWLDEVIKTTGDDGAAATYRWMIARHTAWSEGRLRKLSEPARARFRDEILAALSWTIAHNGAT